jgi:hypothetical protein
MLHAAGDAGAPLRMRLLQLLLLLGQLGQLLSLRALDLARAAGGPLRLRRLVLGPFRSSLNPIGLMNADWVAGEVMRQALDWNCGLVIVTPNPLTYLLMPLATLSRWAYFRLTTRASGP